jgi:hypothetical protein
MNVMQNTQNLLRETLQVELREFAQFCSEQGIHSVLAATMAMNQCFVAAAAVAEQSFGMEKDRYLHQAALVWDLAQEAKAKAKGKANG